RRRHTRFDCDWSSDVCSSDLSFTSQMAMRFSRSDCKSWATMSADGQRIGLHLVVHDLQSLRENRIAIWDVKEKRPVFIYSQPMEIGRASCRESDSTYRAGQPQ